jgi:GNAT superfamily N-acetyltransferase
MSASLSMRAWYGYSQGLFLALEEFAYDRRTRPHRQSHDEKAQWNCMMTSPITITHPQSFLLRRGTAADTYTAFTILERSLADLNRRIGSTAARSADNPAALARTWQLRRSMFEHLTDTADQFWLAEEEGQAIGYARSILREDVRVLTELFALPGRQSTGLGRALLARAFPAGGTERRVIISSPDLRAQSLYLKAGVYPRFSAYYFGRVPEPVRVDKDLVMKPAPASTETLEILGQLDLVVLGHRRDSDHAWLRTERQGYLYYRDGRPVGYGYLGVQNGPFALLNHADFPAVLAQAETAAATAGAGHIGFEVPAINQVAMDTLLARGYKIDVLVAQFMTGEPLGDLSKYIITSPPFIL